MMKSLLDKITFRLLIGQVLPGAFLALTLRIYLKILSHHVIPPINPEGILLLYDQELRATSSTYGLVIFTTFSAVLGLVLHTTSNLMTANLESFRDNCLDDKNRWVHKDPKKVRQRSRVRRWCAILWSKDVIALILLVGPLMMLFDFLSVLWSRPKELYKEVNLMRAPLSNIVDIEAVISDFEYCADYSINMALSIAAHFLFCCVVLYGASYHAYTMLYLVVIYVAASLHYLSFRIVRHSADNAINLVFAVHHATDAAPPSNQRKREEI